jgi:hypothetical protein
MTLNYVMTLLYSSRILYSSTSFNGSEFYPKPTGLRLRLTLDSVSYFTAFRVTNILIPLSATQNDFSFNFSR